MPPELSIMLCTARQTFCKVYYRDGQLFSIAFYESVLAFEANYFIHFKCQQRVIGT